MKDALTQSKACLQLQVEDIIKNDEVYHVIYKMVRRIAKNQNKIDDVNVIFVFIEELETHI